MSLRDSATHAVYRWVALSVVATCTAAPCACGQDNGDIATIRVESRQVIVPTTVRVWVPDRDYYGGRLRGYYDAVHLTARDFHLFEDEKEQPVDSSAMVRPYWTGLQGDNLGYQQGIALTPRGEWTNLRVSRVNTDLFAAPLYVIAYRPPLSPEGSCHRIKIMVDAKDVSGHSQTAAESAAHLFGNMIEQSRVEEVKRSKLVLRYRTQYCNVAHAASDPLYGTPISKELENLATDDKAEEEGFYVGAFDLFDESSRSRIHVALDFPNLPDQTGNSGFQAALLGIFDPANGSRAARFSDSKVEGCSFPWKGPDAVIVIKGMCGRENFYNHYETEVDLPAGDYDLRVAIDFGGALRRAEVPVSVPAPTRRLAVSGIALCRRYFDPNQASNWPQLPPDGVPTMPFELKPLISKGIEFTPTGDARFEKKDSLAAYFEVYEPLLVAEQNQTGGGNVHVQFQMRVVDAKTGKIESDTGFRPADGYVNTGKAVIPISEKIAIEELSPGDYRLQVRAMDSSGSSTDWRSTSFTRE